MGVVVNKLDKVNWSKERFDEIVSKLKIFLRQAGFKESDVTYIPCSGLTGENLVKEPIDPELISWYNGPTLITVIGEWLCFSVRKLLTFSLFGGTSFEFHSGQFFKDNFSNSKIIDGLSFNVKFESGVK